MQDDLPAAEARALLGPRRILGVSVKTPEQAIAAAAAGADYLGAGAGADSEYRGQKRYKPENRKRQKIGYTTPEQAIAAAATGADCLAAVAVEESEEWNIWMRFHELQ